MHWIHVCRIKNAYKRFKSFANSIITLWLVTVLVVFFKRGKINQFYRVRLFLCINHDEDTHTSNLMFVDIFEIIENLLQLLSHVRDCLLINLFFRILEYLCYPLLRFFIVRMKLVSLLLDLTCDWVFQAHTADCKAVFLSCPLVVFQLTRLHNKSSSPHAINGHSRSAKFYVNERCILLSEQ